MRRPCVITHPVVVNGGKPFEALRATARYYEFEDTVEIVVKNDSRLLYEFMYLIKPPMEEIYNLIELIQWQLAQALNAPVLATEEVLAGLPKDAKVYTIDAKTGDALKCTFDEEYGWGCRIGHFDEASALGRPYRIFTINDTKTAEYLRQFTFEGVRINKEKETD